MQKINELTSTDVVQHNIEKLKELFPTAVSEGKLLVEELQALMGEYIEKDKEYYQMTWAGKTEAQKEANKVSTGTLRPAKDESKDWDTTGNIVIEGDNLEVLKLLQKTYSNKVKMIYIDPPYNTGNDFVYKDNYKDNLSNYLELTGQTDEEGRKLKSNADSDGRYHSNWLNMMYPRLKLARNLLTDDGVIFISIDDNEQANLKKMCDEVFGEENFIAIICHKSRASISNDKIISSNHNFLLLYSKEYSSIFNNRQQFGIKPDLTSYNKQDKNGEYYKLTPVDGPGGARKGNPYYEFEGVIGYWRYSYETMKELYEKGEIIVTENNLQRKTFLKNMLHKKRTVSTWWDEGFLTSNATRELSKIMQEKVFDNPKNINLIKRCLELSSSTDSIVLDFFSGSGTTAHGVMELNAEDSGNRKCISVQLPEPTDEKSEAYKAGYTTIAEITKERIRRAGELIKKEHKDKVGIDKLDVGFRVFKLDSSNIKAWDTSVENFEEQLDMFAQNNGENIKQDRTEEDILFEILLKYGLELTVPIIEKQIAGNKVYNIGFGSMYICLDDKVNPEVAKGIGVWHKEEFTDNNPSVIFKDNGFATDADKTNTVQTLKQFGISNVKSI